MIRFTATDYGRIAAAICLALGLAACANGTTPATVVDVQSIANDVKQVATSANNALSQPSVQALIPAASLPKVQAALADLIKVSGDMAANPSSAVTKGNVAVVEADLNALVASVAGIPLPPPYGDYLTAATIIMPVVEAAIGLVLPASASAVAPGGHDLAWARAHVGPPLAAN